MIPYSSLLHACTDKLDFLPPKMSVLYNGFITLNTPTSQLFWVFVKTTGENVQQRELSSCS